MRHRGKKIEELFRILLLIFVCLAGVLLIYSWIVKYEPKNVESVNPVIAKKNPTKAKALKEAVEAAMSGAQGTYSIFIKNLKNGQTYSLNEHKSFVAGSLYKLWIMAETYQQIQEGKFTEDQVLSEDVVTLNQIFNIDSDQAELTEGTVTLTVHDALLQMITISHNYSALLLTENIKLSSVATFLKENGLNESSVGTAGDPPKTTAFDIALFLEKLYHGKLASQQYTDEMITFLKNQHLNDGLPKYLPNQSEVAHKTGDIDWFKHDGGIVFSEKGDYIIVAMSESDFPAGAQERIALLSKAVFDYFQN